MRGKYDLDFNENDGNDRDEEAERGYWANKMEFLLACFGNAWNFSTWSRFPFLCYVYGGITVYFIPFVIMLFHVGFPVLLQEMTLGQYSSQGVLSVWRMCPLFKGVGVSILLFLIVYLCVFVVPILSWQAYYMYISFTTPWRSCDNAWNTNGCIEAGTLRTRRLDILSAEICEERSFLVENDGYCYDNGTRIAIHDYEAHRNQTPYEMTAMQEYFTHHFAAFGPTNFEISEVNWMKTVFLAASWVVIALCLCRGVRSYGKAVYITSTVPLVLLIVFLVRAVTLPGAKAGMDYIFCPDYTQLRNPMLWYHAVAEVIYSLGLGYGGFLTLASYSRFRNFYPRDAFIVVLVHVIVKVMVAVIVFGFAGYITEMNGISISQVATGGIHVLFVAIPEALAHFPASSVWCFFFFFLVFVMLLGQALTMMEVISAVLSDLWRPLRRFRFILVGALSCIFFLIGILVCTPAGEAIIYSIDVHIHHYPHLIIICAMSASITIFYGIFSIRHDIALMLGDRSIWQIVIAVLALIPAAIHWFLLPISSIAYLVLVAMNYFYHSDYPVEYQYAGFSILGLILLPMILCPIILFIIACRNRSCLPVIEPESKWGPQLSCFRVRATHLPNNSVDPATVEFIQLERTASNTPYLVFSNESMADMFNPQDQAPEKL